MSSNSVGPPRPPPRSVIDALMRLIRNQLPGLGIGAIITRQIMNQVIDIIKRNIMALLGGGLMSAGLAALLPSLALVLVQSLGWTASGVLAGSFAASLQSVVYAGSTSGLFSMLQAFGATAAIASPAVLALGGIFLAVGAGFFGYWLYKRIRTRREGSGTGRSSGDGDDADTPSPSSRNAVAKRSSTFNFFNFFRSKGKPKSD